jgi:bisphosphoglycerate-dependent phosphoglycerate mutase
MKKVYLIRHGESEFNAAVEKGIILDTHDPPLTELGISQAQKLGQELKDIIFDVILVSPLKRAQQTFAKAKLTSNKWETVPLIREYGTDPCDILENEVDFKETESGILERCQSIKAMLRSRDEITIGLVCHGDLIFYLTSHDGDYGEWLDNAEYTFLSI